MEWRSSLRSDARQKIARRIMDTLQKYMPHNPPEGMNELACRLEEKIYMTAIDQQDYVRRISVVVLSLEIKSQTTNNPAAGNPPDASSQPGSSALMPQQQAQQGQPQPQQIQPHQLQAQKLLSNGQQVMQQRAVSEASSESGQTAQSAALTDEQDMVWNKLQYLKDKYLQDLNDLLQRQNLKEKYLQDLNDLLQMLHVQRSQQTMSNNPLANQPNYLLLNHSKDLLNRVIRYLSASKANLPKEFGLDKVEVFEKQIVKIMETFKKHNLPQHQHQQQPPPQQGMLGRQMSTEQHAPVCNRSWHLL